MGTEQSRGFLARVGDGEYFEYMGQVYRAPVFNPLDVDGYRQGARWECPMWHWAKRLQTLLTVILPSR